MRYLKQQLNLRVGRAIQKKRRERRITQEGLKIKITQFWESKLKGMGFIESEIEQYFDGELSETLKKKLKKFGIDEKYKPIAVSTISKYENGNWDIPAWYAALMKEILGDFSI